LEAKDKNKDNDSLAESLVTYDEKSSATELKVNDLESHFVNLEMGVD
jgi:hypothetical protein